MIWRILIIILEIIDNIVEICLYLLIIISNSILIINYLRHYWLFERLLLNINDNLKLILKYARKH